MVALIDGPVFPLWAPEIDDISFDSLRSWILRKMKKMRMAMSTIAMPAPITIPTIWRENKQIELEQSDSTHRTLKIPGMFALFMTSFDSNAPCLSAAPPPQTS